MTSQPSDSYLDERAQSRATAVALIALVSSLGTLVCCALPALMVALGAGAVLAGLVSAVPQVVAFSEYKEAIFAVAALLLLGAAGLRYATRNAPCPVDPAQAQACRRARRLSGIFLNAAAACYLVGFFFAFLAVHILT